jgi:transposase
MDKYIGLDVHQASCTMAVIGASGRRLRSLVVDTNGQALVDALIGVAGTRYLCLEEGTQSEWLYEILSPHVERMVVTVPAKRRGSKSDLRDAWQLAEELRIGALRTVVYKAPSSIAALRSAVRCYTMLTGDWVRIRNRLKAVYRSRGIRTDGSVYAAESRERWERQLPASQRPLARSLGEQFDAQELLRDQARKRLRVEARKHSIVKLLATAPGMGELRAAQVVAVVVTPDRFRTTRQFWSYCGFGIVTHTSSEWTRHGNDWVRARQIHTRGLNHNRNPLLKAAFKGAATTVIQQLPEHPLHRAYQRLTASGTKPNLAKVTLARRIAAAVLAMWKKKEAYDPAKQCGAQAAPES